MIENSELLLKLQRLTNKELRTQKLETGEIDFRKETSLFLFSARQVASEMGVKSKVLMELIESDCEAVITVEGKDVLLSAPDLSERLDNFYLMNS